MLRLTLNIVLLALSLAAAYWASLPTRDNVAGQVLLLDLDPAELTAVTYTSPEATAKLYKEQGEYWVELKDSGNSELFKANSEASKLVQGLPLYAVRAVGPAESLTLEDYGLATPARFISLTRGQGDQLETFKLDIGARNFGTRNFFVRSHADDQVYLWDDAMIMLLSMSKTRLFERELLQVSLSEVTALQLAVGAGAKPKWAFQDALDQKAKLGWRLGSARKTSAGYAVDTQLTTWVKKVSKIFVVRYLPKQPLKNLVLQLEYMAGKRSLGVLQIYKEVLPTGGEKYLAKSTLGGDAIMEVNQTRVAQVIADLSIVFP